MDNGCIGVAVAVGGAVGDGVSVGVAVAVAVAVATAVALAVGVSVAGGGDADVVAGVFGTEVGIVVGETGRVFLAAGMLVGSNTPTPCDSGV
jgi:hypothetical protein